MLTQGFWSMLTALMIAGGGLLAILGFGGDRVPLGIIGLIIVVIGIVLLVRHFTDILAEFGRRRRG